MKKGFTLVELSIVLVIIGLLIGGILVGQSMIESAKVNAQIKQIQQLDIAVSNFILKFKQIPGDSNRFGTSGNNDGLVDGGPALGSNPLYFSTEVANFWKHLSDSGILPNTNYSNTIAATGIVQGINGNMPKSSINDKAGVLAATSRKWIGRDVKMAFYQIGDYRPVTLSNQFIQIVGGAALSPLQAYQIDSKMDDGMPNAGIVGPVWVGGGSAWIGYSGSGGICQDNTSSTGVYYTTNNVVCGITIQIMSQSGGMPKRASEF